MSDVTPNSQSSQSPPPLPSKLPFRLISKTIGQGAYAFIRKAVPLNASKPVIAVKIINKEHAIRKGRLSHKQLELEVALHLHLRKHKNIIQCLSTGEDVNWRWIAMELAEGGDLFDKIEADEGVGEDVAHFYFTQLISAIGYMHSKGVAHRDIKPENMLLSGQGDLKLADFGLAALFSNNGRERLCNGVCGSPPYIAPEIVSGKRNRRQDVLESGYKPDISDIWSCGVVLFVLLVGNTPWDEPTFNSYEFEEYVRTRGRPEDELWHQIPTDVLSLLRGMLNVETSCRFKLHEVRVHPWFTRPNEHLSSSGTAANPVGLATKMLESLRIDFSKDPMARRMTAQGLPRDAMEVEVNATAASSAPADTGFRSIPSTQPDPLIADMEFDWERLGLAGNLGFHSASQPTIRTTRHAASQPLQASPLLSDLCTDPALSQFTSTPTVPQSLTQAAQRFADIVPPHSFTRFFSPLPFSLLLPLLSEALHRLGIPVAAFSDEQLRGERVWIQVRTVDGRGQGLCGGLAVEWMGTEMDDGSDCVEVRFLKVKGDPVEWRRLFKRVVVLCKEAVYVPGY